MLPIASYCTRRLWPPCALLASMPDDGVGPYTFRSEDRRRGRPKKKNNFANFNKDQKQEAKEAVQCSTTTWEVS